VSPLVHDHAMPICDWCELPIVGDAWDWHCTVGHPRCIVREAVGIWASRPIPGETAPPIDHAALEEVSKAGICSWCFDQLGDQRAEFNGGVGHPECARYAYTALAGDGAMPWPIPEPSIHETDGFLERLGRAAIKHGVNRRRLERAIKEAIHG
jgi:hypothetical protein